MRGAWFVIAFGMIILFTPGSSFAEEFAGKLERVDWETVTLRDGDNNKVVARVDIQKRQQAAIHLGKTVTVELLNDLNDDGSPRAVLFRPCR